MTTDFLIENDSRLARAIYGRWRNKNLDIDETLRVFDRLMALELRSKGSAAHEMGLVTTWLEDNGLTGHAREAEIRKVLADLPQATTTTKASPRKTDSSTITKPKADGRTGWFDDVMRPASTIRGQAAEKPWNRVADEEIGGFIAHITPVDGKYDVRANTCQVDWTYLPFYDKSVTLIRVLDSTWDKDRLLVYYLSHGGSLHRLSGASPPIHQINTAAKIELTEGNVLEYVRFFCFFVRGDEGPFHIIEGLQDPFLPDNLDGATRSILESKAVPASYRGINSTGHYLCDGLVFYSNAMFVSNFAVHADGMIEMLDDDPVAGDLPDRIDEPLA